jgi:hypothetical protein
MKNKILIINPNWIEGLWGKNGCDVLWTRKNFNLFDKIINFFFSRFLSYDFFDRKNWWKDCLGYETIIIIDSTKDTLNQSKIIENHVSPKTKLIFYMVNMASYTSNLDLFSNRWSKWSFSRKDSMKNGLKYGETFFFKGFSENLPTVKTVYDSFFIGLDKGRLSYLNQTKKQYENLGLHSLFYIVDNVKALFNKKYKKRLDYYGVIDLVNSSRSITEIVMLGQEGLTLRSMESIFLKKKLITNNPEIRNKNIYNPNNIFILGEDNIKDLPLFLNKPYQEIDNKIVDSYIYSNWLKRLINDIEYQKI